jgi:thiosulfate/3-mercaptopyruvate sulfurtransferase
MPLLIDARELADLLAADDRVRVLDVRYRLDRPDGRPEYRAGHLPGAVYVDLESELARHGEPRDGRHPLPSLDTLQAAARRWGLDDGDTVVVYDDWAMLGASRAWWALSGAGVADVRVLDGGLGAWTSAGLPLEEGDVRVPEGSIVLHERAGGAIGMTDAAAWPERGILLDARAPERYRGEVEPYDPQAGHIPGAVNLPSTDYLDGGRFRDPAAIRAAFAAVGAADGTPVAAYCGSGITAAQAALAGALAGIDVAVYPGSWSQWSNTEGMPVATGPTP